MALPDVVVLFAAALGTALATGLGVVPVAVMGARAERWRPALTGATAGVMTVAAITGLLRPALDAGRPGAVAVGLVAGVAFYALARHALPAGGWSAFGGAAGRPGTLIFLVLLVHSLPEGFAVGSAWASTTAGLAPFVVAAIAWQNIPEGTSIAIPMRQAGASTPAMVAAAIGSSLPQPVGALIAYGLVEQIRALLPVSFAFAAAAMLALVARDLAPGLWAQRGPGAVLGLATGALATFGLARLAGV